MELKLIKYKDKIIENTYAISQLYLRQQQEQSEVHSTKGKIVNHKTSSQPREKPALLKDSTIASLKFEFLHR